MVGCPQPPPHARLEHNSHCTINKYWELLVGFLTLYTVMKVEQTGRKYCNKRNKHRGPKHRVRRATPYDSGRAIRTRVTLQQDPSGDIPCSPTIGRSSKLAEADHRAQNKNSTDEHPRGEKEAPPDPPYPSQGPSAPPFPTQGPLSPPLPLTRPLSSPPRLSPHEAPPDPPARPPAAPSPADHPSPRPLPSLPRSPRPTDAPHSPAVDGGGPLAPARRRRAPPLTSGRRDAPGRGAGGRGPAGALRAASANRDAFTARQPMVARERRSAPALLEDSANERAGKARFGPPSFSSSHSGATRGPGRALLANERAERSAWARGDAARGEEGGIPPANGEAAQPTRPRRPRPLPPPARGKGVTTLRREPIGSGNAEAPPPRPPRWAERGRAVGAERGRKLPRATALQRKHPSALREKPKMRSDGGGGGG
ncbi:translation initiation factor IF-2-like [Harpia harpyja]|uniref:translation initiation factor IF-2-like n=1 Tax=Harpia harpyja TaxID=202280 RepID=UPI0022B16999|nr:translation initiation factor IF-2-like [Harpia harpyja]